MGTPRTGRQDPSAEVLTEAAAAFGLLASPARLHMVWALAHGESDVTGLAERVGGALPAISQHLTKLKLAGLVRSRREGRRQVYFVDPREQAHVVDVVRLLVGRLAERETADAVPAPRTAPAGARPRDTAGVWSHPGASES
ncbi:ArsR/SmtB family transcription factor [Streptomyces collinus]|uniref:ArsR/SmtB family transcription factor n=1 Tax=Streptomyces collinus TaxID=42684 RepID=UPI00368E9E89